MCPQTQPEIGRLTDVRSAAPDMSDPAPLSLVGPALLPEELSRLHILRRVDVASVLGMLSHCEVRRLAVGEQLIRRGQTNQTMYMVLSGRLAVSLDSVHEEPVAHLDAGQTVGEISVLDDSPASATVYAVQPTRLLAVDETTFWQLARASHDFSVNLLLLLAQRMRANNTTLSSNNRKRRKLQQEANLDALTGLHNRRWLDDALPRMVQRAERAGGTLSVVVFDIDHFKHYNDQYGHAAGDAVLTAVARRLTRSLRPNDLAARQGGEEFIVLLADTPLAGAVRVAERLRTSVSAARISSVDHGYLPTVTISLGAAELLAGETPDDLVGRADAAMYRAKRGGRNRVVPASEHPGCRDGAISGVD